jgi:Caspase domain
MRRTTGVSFALWTACLATWAQAPQQRGVITASAQAGPLSTGAYYALLIGIDRYQHLPALVTAVNDAKTVGEALSARYGFRTEYLLDGEATRANVANALNRYRRSLAAGDNLLVYYAGHGQFDKETDKGYWLPADADADSTAYWVIADEITADIRAMPARHVLIVSDSCYSGTLTREGAAAILPTEHDAYIQKMLASKSRTLMASGGKEPVSDSGSAGHSVFAAALLAGLNGIADKSFTAATLFEEYVRQQVAGGSNQAPQYDYIRASGHEAGDFVFFLRPGAAGGAAISSAPTPNATLGAARAPQPNDAADTAVRARDELRSRGIGMDLLNVRNAIAAADVETLKLLTAAKISPSLIEQALREKTGDGNATGARKFFDNTVNSPEAMAWFDQALAAGVDPNMTVASDTYEREGVITEAVRAGNKAAIETLLKHGASPHPYENLWLTTYSTPRFLFPFSYLTDDNHFSLDEKRELAKAYLAAGGVVPEVVAAKGRGWESAMFAAKELQDQAPVKLGMPLPATPALCQEPQSPICVATSKRTGEDWCKAIAAIPNHITYKAGNSSFSPLYEAELTYLLDIQGNRVFFLGLISNGLGRDYALIETSKDGSSWAVYRFMEPEAGMGLCKKTSDGVKLDNCWRRISLQRSAGTDEMKFNDWDISFKVAHDACAAKAPK